MFESGQDVSLLPIRLGTLVEREVEEGEHILWLAQPRAGRFAMRTLPVVLFGIPWTAFAIFWMAGASGFKIPDFKEGFDFFPLFGVPFVLIGLGMLSAPLWAIRKAKGTAYVITERRAIIFEGGLSTKVRSFGPEQLGGIERRERADGSGDIIIERSVTQGQNGQTTEAGFFGIPNVQETERLLREMVEAHERAKGSG